MLLRNTAAAAPPERVIVENFATGRQAVRLADNVRAVEIEEGTQYVYDEVVFQVPEDRHVTTESVAQSFDAWWEYGQQEQEIITLEQRVSDLEDIIIGMLEMEV